MDVVMKCGAHQVFNHNHKSYEKKLMDFTGDEGFDVIIEHLANINLAHDIQMIKKNARVMVVGCRGTVTLNPRFLMLPEASIRGVALGNSSPSEYREMGSAIVAGIEAGWVDPVINREYTMDEVQQVRWMLMRHIFGSFCLRYVEGHLYLHFGCKQICLNSFVMQLQFV